MTQSDDQTRADGNGGEPPRADDLATALQAAESRAEQAKSDYLRVLAELDNVRKRSVRDVESAHRYGLEKFATELLGVKDSLELGLASAESASAETLREGVAATLKLLTKAFEKFSIVELDPAGQPFDPEWHEAMAMQESADHPPGNVLAVVQKGYQLNGRLLRPARVVVARDPASMAGQG
jgi:molecular chaperone GrpE